VPSNSKDSISPQPESKSISNRITDLLAPVVDLGSLRASSSIGLIALAAVVTSIVIAPDLHGLLGAGLALIMLVIAMIDRRRFIVPDPLTAGAFLLALMNAAVGEPDSMLQAVALTVMRGSVCALLFLVLRSLYMRLRGRQGLGLGDVKLAAVAGAWLDWSIMPIAVELAATAALSAYGVRHFLFGQRIAPSSRIPFGLFFAPAIWLGWVMQAWLF
jgi:leader peptidase (prepilin peptidase)/N-methyltransferase